MKITRNQLRKIIREQVEMMATQPEEQEHPDDWNEFDEEGWDIDDDDPSVWDEEDEYSNDIMSDEW